MADHLVEECLPTREYIKGQAYYHVVWDVLMLNAKLLVLSLDHFVRQEPIKDSEALLSTEQRSRAGPFLTVVNHVKRLHNSARVNAVWLRYVRTVLQPSLIILGRSDQPEQDFGMRVLLLVQVDMILSLLISHVVDLYSRDEFL